MDPTWVCQIWFNLTVNRPAMVNTKQEFKIVFPMNGIKCTKWISYINR
jgi:hypothetical protein